MSKGKKKDALPKKKTKKQTSGPRVPLLRKTAGPKPSKTLATHHRESCSILDPFCVSAKGAKRPDGMGPTSISMPIRGYYGIGTDANGAKVFLVVNAGRYGWANTTIAGTAATVSANWGERPGADLLVSHAKEYRIVSAGVTIRSTASTNNTGGNLILRTISSPAPSYSFTLGNMNFSETQMYALQPGFEVTWIAKPIGPKAHSFRPLTEDTNVMTDFDWTGLILEINGGPPSVTCLSVEMVVNVEFTLTEGNSTAIASLVSPSKATNPVALHVQNKVQATMSSFFNGGVDYVEKQVSNLVSSALQDVTRYAPLLLGI